MQQQVAVLQAGSHITTGHHACHPLVQCRSREGLPREAKQKAALSGAHSRMLREYWSKNGR